ncbi:MAG: hypothetical protein Q8935_16230 [Bacillota bacterium]|nr:hypothetical protein [Bacillota bacterium]
MATSWLVTSSSVSTTGTFTSFVPAGALTGTTELGYILISAERLLIECCESLSLVTLIPPLFDH